LDVAHWSAGLLLAVLAGCAEAPVAPALAVVDCPSSSLLAHTRCLAGRDAAGAYVVVAIPERWNGVLVLHAHGGPFLGAPTAARVDEDLVRWAIVPAAGYAWAATSYRQGGVAVRAAGEDIERLRTIALGVLDRPQTIVLHGQSWGGNVAAKEAETAAGRHLFDGVLLTSGVLAGGPRAYEHRFDLRVVYQYLCHDLPRPDEPPYPLWMGLPDDSPLTTAQVTARADDCLGTSHRPDERTPGQARRLQALLSVVGVPEASVANELGFATFTFRDLARRYHGSVFGNIGAVYRGSGDDDALNAGVARYATDPAAARAFADDSDLTGRIDLPVLTMHAIDDPVAFVEMERRFGDRMIAAGHGANLVQTFSDDRVHSYVSDATYVALLGALVAWLQDGTKPTPAAVAAGCIAAASRFPSTCRFRPDFVPAPLESRVTDRVRP
jgi:hypothetical protein